MDWDQNAIKLYVDDQLLNSTELAETVNGDAEGANRSTNPSTCCSTWRLVERQAVTRHKRNFLAGSRLTTLGVPAGQPLNPSCRGSRSRKTESEDAVDLAGLMAFHAL